MLCYIMLSSVVLCCEFRITVLCCVVLCCVVLYCIVLYSMYIVLYCVVFCCYVFCCVVLCFVVMYFVVLCRIELCLCDVVLCYVVLHHVGVCAVVWRTMKSIKFLYLLSLQSSFLSPFFSSYPLIHFKHRMKIKIKYLIK